MDIFISLIILVFLIPITPFIAFAIILEDGWPFWVKLERVSRGQVIKLYKFRTMIKNAHLLKKDLLALNEIKDGPLFKITNDPRITKVGKFLRKFWLDEFPQMINVLKNDLSLVGPRPREPEELKFFPPELKFLGEVKCGVTGLAQIDESSRFSFKRTIELDLEYLKKQSLKLDLEIIFKTILLFLKKRGI